MVSSWFMRRLLCSRGIPLIFFWLTPFCLSSQAGTFTLLHSFSVTGDGAYPFAPVIQGSDGTRPLWIAALAFRCLAREMQPSAPTAGFTFIVNTTGDDGDVVVGDGICETAAGNGQCTLRAAIEEANAQPTDDTITFNIPQTDPGYNGTFWAINLLSALPDLSTNIDIQGLGPDLLTVQRSSGDVFRIFNVTNPGAVSLYGLTLTGGHVTYGNGGAVNNENSGITNITNCTLRQNFASRGAGLCNQSTGTVNVTNSGISGNSASQRGGGISNQSTGTVNVANSTISDNDSTEGGGIRQSGLGTVNVTNCTITGNRGTYVCGGIFNLSGGTVNVTNCTISNNKGGGGLWNDSSGRFNVESSIVALSSGSGAGAPYDVVGNFTSAGFNLIGTTDGSTGFTQPTDQTGTFASPLDPLLDPNGLQDNGGPTQTIGLRPGSPALDKGTSDGLTGGLTTDQRGADFPRTFDDPAIANAGGGDGTDIGAFELQVSAAQSLNISTRLAVGNGDDLLIGGFIITGNASKMVLLRAIGPSLANANPPVAGALADPVLELHQADGTVVTNDNWKDSQEQAITETGIAPGNDLESAILETLPPGAYTAIVSGNNHGTGVALIEAYDLQPESDSKLANISSRGKVETGNDVIIGGFILGPEGRSNARIVVRAIGPSLVDAEVTGALLDPTLELHDSSGNLIANDDNWRDDSAQEAELEADGLAPTDDRESALDVTLAPGAYTVIVRGKDGTTGVALVEVYALDTAVVRSQAR